MKDFYIKFFKGSTGEKYYNPHKDFSSYFLSFDDGARLELMQKPGVTDDNNKLTNLYTGLIHFAISTGSKENVDALTEEISQAGFTILGAPRWTGDGYYESIIADPDNNQVEITI